MAKNPILTKLVPHATRQNEPRNTQNAIRTEKYPSPYKMPTFKLKKNNSTSR